MFRKSALLRALSALALLSVPVAAQTGVNEAADAAEVVAERATTAFERVDPDSEVPAATLPVIDYSVLTYAGLMPLLLDTEVTAPAAPAPAAQATPAAEEAPRGPAVRMIASPVVQALPEPEPAPIAAASAPTPVAVASNDPFVIKSILPVEGAIRYGDWFWDESAAPEAGKLVITVDLEARVISAFRGGHEIGTAVALLGTQSHPTPLGAFPVLRKSREHFSRKYDNAPMPWSLWITNTGIAIHGSTVLNGYASHGCIGVPDEFAAKLFAATNRGDKVIITRGKMIGIGDKVL